MIIISSKQYKFAILTRIERLKLNLHMQGLNFFAIAYPLRKSTPWKE